MDVHAVSIVVQEHVPRVVRERRVTCVLRTTSNGPRKAAIDTARTSVVPLLYATLG